MEGFCSVIKEEKNVKVKDAMLDYLTEIMNDAKILDGHQPKVPTH